MKEIKARPSAISTNALGNIATLFSTMATFLILLLSPNISDQADRSVNDVILIPLEIIRSNRDLRKALKAQPHWQSYDFRTSWYKQTWWIQLVTFIVLEAYRFLYSNRAYATFTFICIHFSFIDRFEGLCCKPKYRENIIHHFIFVFFIYFSTTLPVVRISCMFWYNNFAL